MDDLCIFGQTLKLSIGRKLHHDGFLNELKDMVKLLVLFSLFISLLWFVSDKLIGKVTIGSFMFSRGKELQHWNDMVANQKEQVMNWHTLVS